ncbi:MAG: cellulase family glycosylhydrolase [Bacteroidetes bacterium]|nr:cellulase family glycosylhydrolase [Bacteroidota bacterium]
MNTRLSLFLVLFNCYSISCQFIPPFKTNGPKIVDAKNSEFILKGINWWGINGSHIPYSNDHSKGTNTHGMSFGLHVQQIDTIISAIKKAGFNTIRLPLSNQILHDTTKILAEWVGPNADLIGLTPIEVMDVIVKKLTNQGLFVLLNNHSTTTHWCCNYDFNGLWYGKNKFYSQTTENWISDWKMLAIRYLNNPKVIGADLRNEVRPLRRNGLPLPKNPNWGRKNKRDWHLAATKAGNAIHTVQPNWLIVVEGINARVHFLSQLSFPHLKPIIKKPIKLKIPNKLVYEIHNYSFSWIKANILFVKKQVKYGNVDTEKRKTEYERNWGFVLNPNFKNCAPVILGEFGCSSQGKEVETWLKDLSDFVWEKKMGFCWWTLEEELHNESSYGIMNSELNKINVFDDWRGKYLKQLLDMNP